MDAPFEHESETLDLKEMDRSSEIPGIIAGIGRLDDGSIITEAGMASLFDRHVTSVKRAVQRGELPQPCRLFGQNAWTAGAVRSHIEMRLRLAADEAEKSEKRLAGYSP